MKRMNRLLRALGEPAALQTLLFVFCLSGWLLGLSMIFLRAPEKQVAWLTESGGLNALPPEHARHYLQQALLVSPYDKALWGELAKLEKEMQSASAAQSQIIFLRLQQSEKHGMP